MKRKSKNGVGAPMAPSYAQLKAWLITIVTAHTTERCFKEDCDGCKARTAARILLPTEPSQWGWRSKDG